MGDAVEYLKAGVFVVVVLLGEPGCVNPFAFGSVLRGLLDLCIEFFHAAQFLDVHAGQSQTKPRGVTVGVVETGGDACALRIDVFMGGEPRNLVVKTHDFSVVNPNGRSLRATGVQGLHGCVRDQGVKFHFSPLASLQVGQNLAYAL